MFTYSTKFVHGPDEKHFSRVVNFLKDVNSLRRVQENVGYRIPDESELSGAAFDCNKNLPVVLADTPYLTPCEVFYTPTPMC